MTDPMIDPDDLDADRSDTAPLPEPGSWWTPLTRVLVLMVATVALCGLAGAVTITERVTGAWPVSSTVQTVVAFCYVAVLVRAANSPARKGSRR